MNALHTAPECQYLQMLQTDYVESSRRKILRRKQCSIGLVRGIAHRLEEMVLHVLNEKCGKTRRLGPIFF